MNDFDACLIQRICIFDLSRPGRDYESLVTQASRTLSTGVHMCDCRKCHLCSQRGGEKLVSGAYCPACMRALMGQSACAWVLDACTVSA